MRSELYRSWRACLAAPLILCLTSCDRSQPLEPAVQAASSGTGGPTVKAPSNTNAVAVSANRIDVNWQDNSTNETGFEVHRSTQGPSGTFSLRASTGANVASYSDIGLDGLTQYCYEIRAFRTYDGKTSYSQFSPSACATTPTPPAPIAPSGADAKPASSTAVDVSWIDNSTNEGGFRVERSLDGAATWSSAGTVGPNVTSSTDGARTSEQQVCYRVIAFNASGDSPPSNTDCTTPPAAPTGLTATGLDIPAIDLAWTDNSAVEDGYEVLRSADGSYFAVIAALPANNTSYHDAAVTGNPRYWYSVRATKDGGFSSRSSSAIAATSRPSAPSGTEAVPWGSSAVQVTWFDNSANEDGFRVERSIDGGGTWVTAGTTTYGYGGPFPDGGRTPDEQVCYRVVAFNTIGDSPPSNTDCTAPPAAPTGLVATTVEGLAIDLTWSDNSTVEDGYLVQGSLGYCDEYDCWEYYEPIATLGANATSYRAAGGYDAYQVVALKDGGRSDPSNAATATTPTAPE